ncbi:Gas vesicle synthesis protein GvpL/GvpF [Streptomyces sp. 2131.1]|uniref:GvpL/GvpF family gas vesicle protein n=1 Tax=Streptomyces sp. 2131.1 TaxID=1855346 RepID=UPI00089CFE41|nr:GvpL/GvpF family gas vesicle protein [Streptomyces sp. 2131.1]SEE37096.1 Gas vesicle synthesis protein GvpL/GvpF [Streptomyces sp. 2131.1]
MTEDIPAPAEAGTEAVYVYAVCRAEEPPDLTGPAGLSCESPLRPLAVGPALTAVVQTVRAADFTDEAWQARLADEPELERYARAHHEVVCAVAARLPTVPLPLATLYHDEQRARAALSRESRRFHAALERTANHSEWGVKVYVTDAPAGQAAGAAPQPPAAGAGAGRAYLDRKRSLRDRRERQRSDALRIADAVDADVSALATASRRLPPHGGRAPEERRTQVLNATYLVAGERAAELARLARNLRERTGAQVELSGPWVPYSFVGEV